MLFSEPVLQPVHLKLFSTQPEVAYPITKNVWMLISFMRSYGTKYSRMDQVKFVEDSL